jgi:Calx-beta domain-containing protein
MTNGVTIRLTGRRVGVAMLATLTLVLGVFRPATSHAAVLPTVSVNDVSVTEGNAGTKAATFTLTLSAKMKGASVRWATQDGTAKAPSDYVAASGMARFSGPHLTKKISVIINGDTTYEADETFTVVLSSPVKATIGTGTGTGTILNDDPAPTVAVADASVPELDTGQTSQASVPVSLSAASGLPASVDYTTNDVTATAGSDYQTTSGTVTFSPGETQKSVLVPVIGDTLVEGNETFTLDISSPSGATLGTASSTVTIIDNDSPPPLLPDLSIGNTNVREGDSGSKLMNFTVTMSTTSLTDVTVDYASASGTATTAAPNIDYLPVSGTLTIPAGQTSGTISVTVNGDKLLEPNETLFVNLTNPSGAYVTGGQGLGIIKNDDTKVTVRGRLRRGRVHASGRFSPSGATKRLTVTLYRLKNGKYVRVGAHRVLLHGVGDVNGDGVADAKYATTWLHEPHGRYRVTARFKGNANFRACSASFRFKG